MSWDYINAKFPNMDVRGVCQSVPFSNNHDALPFQQVYAV